MRTCGAMSSLPHGITATWPWVVAPWAPSRTSHWPTACTPGPATHAKHAPVLLLAGGGLLVMQLWRNDMLEAVLEVDSQLKIKSAGG